MPTKTKRRAPAHLTKSTSKNGHSHNGRASTNGEASKEHMRSGILRAKKRKPGESERDPQVEKAHEETYNRWKEFEGQRYTGMKVGSHHKWYYDQGIWREQKMTPDEWTFDFAVKKRRAGKAPEGSGVPVGTEYHWYIFAHQNVKKLNANIYSTALSGIKFKVAHKRGNSEKWSVSEPTQKKRIVKFLEEMLDELKGRA
jgi:hypothetical protein